MVSFMHILRVTLIQLQMLNRMSDTIHVGRLDGPAVPVIF